MYVGVPFVDHCYYHYAIEYIHYRTYIIDEKLHHDHFMRIAQEHNENVGLEVF